MDEITELLARWQGGDRAARERLIGEVYGELHRLARRELARRDLSHPTLEPTMLVHEAYLKLDNSGRLRDGEERRFHDRGHFFAVASKAMRQIVVDHARRRTAQKRGGEEMDLSLDDRQIAVEDQAEMILALDQALDRLSEIEERLTRVVECRFFAGLGVQETAAALGVDRRTVHRDWIKARALLKRDLATA
ncbi:MAG: ECF-type sigma factor [Holophagales bacterium]|nr:ECF-type sigma factor [Holophagales bacterium]